MEEVKSKFGSDLNKKAKKVKKEKKSKLKKKDKQRRSSDSREKDNKRRHKKQNRERKSKNVSYCSDTSSKSDEQGDDVWTERKTSSTEATMQRDDWMTETLMLKTYSRERSESKNSIETRQKKQVDVYDPTKCPRELNPYWKTTGTGLPASFKKPKDEDFDSKQVRCIPTTTRNSEQRNWQKQTSEADVVVKKCSGLPEEKQLLTDQQMNELGAKLVKAELMDNIELAAELRQKLEDARAFRTASGEQRTLQKNVEAEHLLLTLTDSCGNARPLAQCSAGSSTSSNVYESRNGRNAQKRRRVETHEGGERVRFFADDDRYNIKQMFEREKYSTAASSNLQFADIVSKHKNPNDDLDDIFADKIRKNISESDLDREECKRAMNEQEKLHTKIKNCDKCLDSEKMDKERIVSMSDKVCLMLPRYIGLQTGHCIIVPVQHVVCSTQLDEDTWEEVENYRKALTRMFASQHKDVIFYEIANKLHRQPHLSIHCVPIASKDCEMAPFSFKKSIEESEYEWSVNRQLISLKSKTLRSAIPKGLPYFWVNFGMESGFAHVIEDQERFPSYFAEEIIGGMLKMDPRKWRRPLLEQQIGYKVKNFSNWWKTYDFTKS